MGGQVYKANMGPVEGSHKAGPETVTQHQQQQPRGSFTYASRRGTGNSDTATQASNQGLAGGVLAARNPAQQVWYAFLRLLPCLKHDKVMLPCKSLTNNQQVHGHILGWERLIVCGQECMVA